LATYDCIARGQDVNIERVVGPLARRQFRPRQSFGDAAGDETPKGDVGAHRVDMRIVRAQSKRALDVLDRNVRLAEPCFHEPTEGPRPGQIGIERQCALDEGGFNAILR
jgi:hypothetical protein